MRPDITQDPFFGGQRGGRKRGRQESGARNSRNQLVSLWISSDSIV